MTFQSAQITFFSGTGGAKRIAEAFAQELSDRGLAVSRNDLDHSFANQEQRVAGDNPEPAELVLLIFAVHAFDAPDPVYTWLRHADLKNQKVAVISVSGGGEAWPNLGCRNACCKLVEERGGQVVYEYMMCMPSNWVYTPNDQVAMHLIQIVPHKAGRILDDVLAGKVRRTHFKMSPARALITRLEKEHAHEFPGEIRIDEHCTACGLCERHCPVNNIQIQQGRPVFKDQCVMCFRCIYACPVHAMQTSNFMVLKKGYSLSEVEKRMQGVELEPVEKCCKGTTLKYLLDQDF